jgi:2-hydroxy-3-keto-5-methylthiopentenyl-1-phosphate phosphatase
MRTQVKRDRDKTVPVAGAAAAPLRADVTAPATTTLVLDFDGTITEVDLLDQIASSFGDPEVYDEVERGLHGGRLTLRDVITREFAPVRRRLDDVVAWVLANVRLRRGLPELLALARARGWRVLVLSSGFVELIEPVLEREGLDVELKANRVEPELSGWRVIWRDETVCTECGEACKRTGLPTDGEIVYVGDGISDRCAALASDRIFATRGLARFLTERGVPFETFDDFHDVVAALRTRG